MSRRDAWERESPNWVRWARTPGHDSYWRFHRDRFLGLLPRPGRLTLDLGAGEGRLARHLLALGHRVVAVDGSPSMARACANADPTPAAVVADIARLPVATGVAELAVAFMSLQDVDDTSGAVREAARVLEPGGRLCLAIVHPINSAGSFEGASDDPTRPFVMRGSYFERRAYADDIERDGLQMRFESLHLPLEAYSRALEDSGFLIEAIREVTEPNPDDKWHRLPLFLHLRAVRGG